MWTKKDARVGANPTIVLSYHVFGRKQGESRCGVKIGNAVRIPSCISISNRFLLAARKDGCLPPLIGRLSKENKHEGND